MTQLTVGTSGMVEQARIVKSSGNALLDMAALTAAAGMECVPYRTNGALAPVLVNKPFDFTLNPRLKKVPPPPEEVDGYGRFLRERALSLKAPALPQQ